MDLELALKLIKTISEESGYVIDSEGSNQFEIYQEQWHGSAYWVQINSSGYVEVSPWESKEESYDRALYSLRSMSDVIQFCNILVQGEELRAKRRN